MLTRRFRGLVLATAGACLLAVPTAQAAGTPEEKCQATKNKLIGKYMACRHNAEAKLATSGDVGKYQGSRSKCDQKFDDQWLKASLKVPTGCFDWVLQTSDFKDLMDRQADAFAAALGDGNLVRYTFPASGQTTSYGPDSDGAVRAGGMARFHYNFDGLGNFDGTITDENTGLMWEIKTNDGSIHDKDNFYTWCNDTAPANGVCDSGTNAMDGTIVTTFLATLNAGSGFAGYTDWRIPNIKELQSIVDHEIASPGPAVYSVFNSTCTPGCAAGSCSCTSSVYTWSSTTYVPDPSRAWMMVFSDGDPGAYYKDDDRPVRAVRAGS